MNSQGIVYRVTGESRRGRIASYHQKPSPLKLNKTPYRVDVAGLKPVQQRETIMLDGREFVSKFTIGFEVEKNSLHRDAVREYEIFCGFETDSSCGYEAVTHVLPLLPAGLWRNKVYDMMVKAERIIDDRWSPSGTNCGGHITITVTGMPAKDVLSRLRSHVGIFYALFRGRLMNHFCCQNLTCLPDDRRAEWYNFEPLSYHDRTRYQALLVKSFSDYTSGIEFRIPSRFESVKQLMRRYELMYEVVNFAINNPEGSHAALMHIVRPILISMYNGDIAKVERAIAFAAHFRKFILTGKVNKVVQPFVDVGCTHQDRWETSFLREWRREHNPSIPARRATTRPRPIPASELINLDNAIVSGDD